MENVWIEFKNIETGNVNRVFRQSSKDCLKTGSQISLYIKDIQEPENVYITDIYTWSERGISVKDADIFIEYATKEYITKIERDKKLKELFND